MNTVFAAQNINSVPEYVASWESLIYPWNEFDVFVSEMMKTDHRDYFILYQVQDKITLKTLRVFKSAATDQSHLNTKELFVLVLLSWWISRLTVPVHIKQIRISYFWNGRCFFGIFPALFQ